MACKYFYESTDGCALSASQRFVVRFRRPDQDFEALEAQGVDTWDYRVVASFVNDQFDVCPIQGESNGVTTDCPMYKER